jgi:hypothetical protein
MGWGGGAVEVELDEGGFRLLFSKFRRLGLGLKGCRRRRGGRISSSALVVWGRAWSSSALVIYGYLGVVGVF